MNKFTPTETVNQIGKLNLSGNVIPSNWWSHIKLPSGKPDCTAIILLSDIVYWYRPTEIRDELTGELLGFRKRFHGDKLQRSYQAFANQFGFSKREATDALKRLRHAGLITLELRTVTTSEGSTLNNVLYVEVVPEAICAITNNVQNKDDVDSKSGTPITFERNTPSVETEHLLHSDVSVPTLKSDTYTETTTEITTENIINRENADEKKSQPSSKKTKSQKRAMPEDFAPTEKHQALASELGVSLQEEFLKFTDHHLSKGSVFADWGRALNTWLRNASEFKRGQQRNQTPPKTAVGGYIDCGNGLYIQDW
ncbi:DNA replication protein DnaD [Proteus sp. G2639]|uniref:DNA replication protein DnaD n=1 Tax=Proteus sp. G2672 TaxID=2698884 RepID=UPI0013765DE7|nr:DNA replication protein DnaD [Proteus sp. G2672]NBL77959.1 DNA replication protein DnaD [Proteus sp. G2672]NBN60476.1 DNA replication protein DnaD [Proteus sp. G2639]